MSLHAPPYGSGECERVSELLSWYANDTLGATDRSLVETHTDACEVCRTTLAIERRIVDAIRAPRDNIEPSHHAGWQKLAARLDHLPVKPVVTAPEPIAAAVLPRRRRLNWFATLGAAVAVQAAVIAVMAVALVRYQQAEVAPRYHTLSNADQTLASAEGGPLIRVAFDSSVNEAEARTVAESLAGRILAGPSPENVYTFELSADPASAANLEVKVSGLRHHAHVLLVEPVVLGPRSTTK